MLMLGPKFVMLMLSVLLTGWGAPLVPTLAYSLLRYNIRLNILTLNKKTIHVKQLVKVTPYLIHLKHLSVCAETARSRLS